MSDTKPRHGAANAGAIETARLSLVTMDTDVLAAFASGDVTRAASLMQVHIDNECHVPAALAQLRLSQLQDDPSLSDWLLRAIIRRSDAKLVGYIGFHTRPDPEYLRDIAPNAVEFGYTVFAPYRRNGIAFEAALGIIEWANAVHDVTDFVASVSPDNAASVGLIKKLSGNMSVRKIGHHMDPEDGPEDIYLLRKESSSQ